MSEATIRSGDTVDVASVLTLWRAAASLPTVTDTESSLNDLLRRDPGALLLAECAGEPVGSLIVGWDGWRGSFYRLAVHPSQRRRGIATRLVRAGEQRLSDLGAIRLTAIVADDERAAAALWASLGYSRQDRRGRYVRQLPGPRRLRG